MISVIVPIYNVEPYLARCINSIVNQTFRDLEIILVNDGSTDNSLSICREYEKEDERIVVIDQRNKGLSGARNTGIDKSTGDYIFFVDSDDWIHPRSLEILMENLLGSQAQMAVGSTFKPQEYLIQNNESFSCVVRNMQDAIIYMLTKTGCSACGRLYEKKIFSSLRFPEGRTNEDYAIVVKALEQCTKVCFNSSYLYYYFVRPNSICTSSFSKKNFDSYYMHKDVYEYTHIRHPFCEDITNKLLAEEIIGLASRAINLPEYTDCDEMQEMRSYAKENFNAFISNKTLNWKYKVLLLYYVLGNHFFKMILKLIRK